MDPWQRDWVGICFVCVFGRSIWGLLSIIYPHSFVYSHLVYDSSARSLLIVNSGACAGATEPVFSIVSKPYMCGEYHLFFYIFRWYWTNNITLSLAQYRAILLKSYKCIGAITRDFFARWKFTATSTERLESWEVSRSSRKGSRIEIPARVKTSEARYFRWKHVKSQVFWIRIIMRSWSEIESCVELEMESFSLIYLSKIGM